MKRDSSVITSIRIRLDQAQKILDRNKDIETFNLSEFVRNKLDEEFESSESLIEKEKELLNELKKIKNKKQKVKIKEQKKEETNTNERDWLQKARKRVEESPGEMTENCRVYNMKFGKKISLEEFRGILS